MGMQMSWRNIGTGQGRSREGGLLMMNRAYENRQEYAGDSAMLVSIRSYEEGVPGGSFLSFEYGRRYEFRGLDQMLLMMEDIMDCASVPRPSFEHKSFYGKPYRLEKPEPGQGTSGAGRCPEHLPALPRGKASFELRFRCRQHGSLQGEFIAEAEGGKSAKGVERTGTRTVLFRSALELMRLIYEYLDGAGTV